MEFTTIYLTDTYDVNSLDMYALESLFRVELALGGGPYINVYTIDRSIVDSIADEIGRDNVTEIAYS